MVSIFVYHNHLLESTLHLICFLSMRILVDLFYMKTCSFRGASPRSATEGLFCGEQDPQARYRMASCHNFYCLCCYPLNSWKRSDSWPVVDFPSSSMHRFLNGYTTYLNCPAVCLSFDLSSSCHVLLFLSLCIGM